MNAAVCEKKMELVLFLVLVFSFAYFYQGAGANQNARLDQIRSIVELGQLNLKPFAGSHDIVQVGRKTYPNKAPGVSLVGTVPYYGISRLRSLLTHWFSEDTYHLLSCYLVTVLVVGLSCALGGVIFFRLLGLFDPAPAPRLICTAALFLGTPAFSYSTMLYGHMPSTVLTILSFYLLYKYMVLKPDASRSSRFIFLAGLSGGGAVVTEYPTVLIVTILTIYCFISALWRHSERRLLSCVLLSVSLVLLSLSVFLFDKFNLMALFPELFGRLIDGKELTTPRSTAILVAWGCLVASILSLALFILTCFLSGRRLARFLWFFAGLFLPAAVLLLYNKSVFGYPLYVAYFDKRAAAHSGYRDGFLIGLETKKRDMIKALYQTSFGPFRGFLHLSPFLILIFPGIIYFVRAKKKGLLAALWVLVLGYFLINSMYHYWYGGKALGPRHAMEILPYLCILLFFFIARFPRISSILVALSIFLMLTAVSVRPESYEPHPFRNFYFYDFFDGNLSLNRETTFQKNTVVSSNFNAFNLGEVAGLRGQFSLFPLYLIWLIGGLLMAKLGQEYQASTGGGSNAPSPAWVKIGVLGLIVILVVQVLNLAYQLQIKAYLEDLTGAGTFRVSAAEAPPSGVQARTSPGHRTQVWEVLKNFDPGDTVKVKVQHAAAGNDGGFFIVAFGDSDRDGEPDVELGRSPFLTAKRTADWSYWTLPAPEGKLFVGNSWNEGARVFYELAAWKDPDFSSKMFYSGGGGVPVLSTAPRSTNMAIEVIAGE